jgi:gliding motility associated protien GldN
MFRKYGFAFLAIILFSGIVNAQANLLNAKKVDDIGEKSAEKIAADNDAPLSYGYIDDRDILWSKVVWEFIDMSQKINFPYYYPLDTTNISPDRRSLFDVLMRGIRSGAIKDAYDDSFFTTKITQEEINGRLINNRQNGDFVDTYSIGTQDVTGYMIKGMWYFDKRQGELKYRLLALAPMSKDVQTLGVEGLEERDELFELFWVFFPAVRDVLHDAKVFNPKNASQPISFDHLLNARRFNSVIVREENIYGNRGIEDYVRGNSLFQLLEADKIKESIRDREIDMWSY